MNQTNQDDRYKYAGGLKVLNSIHDLPIEEMSRVTTAGMFLEIWNDLFIAGRAFPFGTTIFPHYQ